MTYYVVLGLYASMMYIMSCNTKGKVSKFCRRVSYLYPLLCIYQNCNMAAVVFGILVTLGQTGLDTDDFKSYAVSAYLIAYALLGTWYIDTQVVRVGIMSVVCIVALNLCPYFYAACIGYAAIIIPLLINAILHKSVPAALMLSADVLLAAAWIFKNKLNKVLLNKLTSYMSQTLFYVGSCMAVGILK